VFSYDKRDTLCRIVEGELGEFQRYSLDNYPLADRDLHFGAGAGNVIFWLAAYHCMDDTTYVVVRIPLDRVREFLTPMAKKLLQ
jgi:hypothetical protein